MSLKRYPRVFGDEYNQERLLNKAASQEGVDQTIDPRGCGTGEKRGRFWIVLIVLLALATAVFLPWLFQRG